MADFDLLNKLTALSKTESGQWAVAEMDKQRQELTENHRRIRELERENLQLRSLHSKDMSVEARIGMFYRSMYFHGNVIDEEKLQAYADGFADHRYHSEKDRDPAARARMVKTVFMEAVSWTWQFLKPEYRDAHMEYLARPEKQEQHANVETKEA